jgi:hypothetical protein
MKEKGGKEEKRESSKRYRRLQEENKHICQILM